PCLLQERPSLALGRAQWGVPCIAHIRRNVPRLTIQGQHFVIQREVAALRIDQRFWESQGRSGSGLSPCPILGPDRFGSRGARGPVNDPMRTALRGEWAV